MTDDPIAALEQFEIDLKLARKTYYEPELRMTDDRKTDPGGLKPSTPPGEMSAEQMQWEILLTVRDLRSSQQLSDEELRLLRLRFDEMVLDVLPRIAKLEAEIKELRPRVQLAEQQCDECPMRKAAGG